MIIPGQLAPTNVPVNTGAVDLSALRPGQSVDARVAGSTPSGATRLVLGTQQLEAQLAQVPPTGTVAHLRVEGSSPNIRLVLTGLTTPRQASAPATSANLAPLPAAAPAAPAATAVAQAVQSAVGIQDSAAPLLTSLQQLTGANTALPEPVANAVRLLLASRLNLTPDQPGRLEQPGRLAQPDRLEQPAQPARLDGPAIENAILRSGVFFEALLAAGTPAGPPQSDFKALLLLMRAVLTGWLGDGTSKSSTGDRATQGGGSPQGGRPPPPTKGAPRAPALPGGQGASVGAPGPVGPALLAQTEAALARLRLSQLASLPEAGSAKEGHRANLEWIVEIPVFAGNQSTMVHLAITREGGAGGVNERRDWRIQFAMQIADLGEVGGQVSLRGGAISVDIWAEQQATRRQFRQSLDELATSLEACGIDVGMIRCRASPPAARGHQAGYFVDARS